MNQINEKGQKHGYWEHYYYNGNLTTKCYYNNDILNGLNVSYWSDGKLCYKCYYKNDKRNGYYENYNHDGKLWIKKYYI